MPPDYFLRRLMAVVSALLLLVVAGCGDSEEKTEPRAGTARDTSMPLRGTIDTTPPVESSGGTTRGFGGYWTWSNERDGLELSLTQSGSRVSGHHEAWTQYGDKVDIVDEDEVSSINGSINDGMANVTFRSGVSGKEGQATLRASGGGLQWEVTSMPEGECYIPKKATLKRSEPENADEEQPELDEGASVQREERRMRSAPAMKEETAGKGGNDAGPERKNSGGENTGGGGD